jgi:hypothetical protein
MALARGCQLCGRHAPDLFTQLIRVNSAEVIIALQHDVRQTKTVEEKCCRDFAA